MAILLNHIVAWCCSTVLMAAGQVDGRRQSFTS